MNEELLKRIVWNPEICGGRPRVRGTRMRVSDVIELMASGASEDEIQQDYPYINLDDIRACLVYASRTLDRVVIQLAAE
jgi:uncharacterized protein (DUF433 family)